MTESNFDANDAVFAGATVAASSLREVGAYGATVSGGLTTGAKAALGAIGTKVAVADVLVSTATAPEGKVAQAFAVSASSNAFGWYVGATTGAALGVGAGPVGIALGGVAGAAIGTVYAFGAKSLANNAIEFHETGGFVELGNQANLLLDQATNSLSLATDYLTAEFGLNGDVCRVSIDGGKVLEFYASNLSLKIKDSAGQIIEQGSAIVSQMSSGLKNALEGFGVDFDNALENSGSDLRIHDFAGIANTSGSYSADEASLSTSTRNGVTLNYSISTSGEVLSGHDFILHQFDNDASYSAYINPNTGDVTVLSVKSNGDSLFVYEDTNGDIIEVEFSDPSELTSAEQSILADHNQNISTAKANGLSGFFQDEIDIGDDVLTSQSLLKTTSLWEGESPDVDVDGETYLLADIAHSFVDAADAITSFIASQVNDGIEWFTAADGAQVAFADWLGANLEDIIDGNLDVDDAFIDLAEHLATSFGTKQLADYTDAHDLLYHALHEDLGINRSDAFDLAGVFSQTLTKFSTAAIDSIGDGWDSTEYANAGVTAFTSAVTYHYARSYFQPDYKTILGDGGVIVWNPTASQSANIGGTVAAVTTIVSSLLSDPSLDRGEYIQLGLNAGLAAGSYIGGQAIAGNLLVQGSALLGPVGIIAGSVLAIIGGNVLSSIIGGKKYYPGEFASKKQLLDSIYTIEDVDDGQGGTVKALVATNPEGSVILLRAGQTYAIGGSGSDNLVGTSADNTNAVNAEDITLDFDVIGLPELRGYGRVKNLSLQMSVDSDLKSEVQTLSAWTLEDIFTDFADFRDDFNTVLYKWAGVNDIAIDSRGANVDDARKLELLEEFDDREFLQFGNVANSSNPQSLTGEGIMRAYDVFEQAVVLPSFLMGMQNEACYPNLGFHGKV